MTFDDMDVAIFSYNRPAYLKNCLASAQQNLPGARIRVFDDNSDDPELVAFLKTLPPEMLVQPTTDSGDSRHGGLYPNMQHALDTAERPYLLMLQDDTQVVRPLDQSDLDAIDAAFAADQSRAFLAVTFLRGARIKRYKRLLAPTPDRLYDTPFSPDQTGYAERIAYFDISLWHVDRLRAAHWQMQPSEHGNVLQARRTFSSMPHLAAPFVFHVPEVPVYRHRQQTLAARLARRVVGTEPKRFVPMTPDACQRLTTRDLSIWPIAEDFLSTVDPKVRRPFVYKDVKRHWWLAALSKAEFKLRHR
ncbi:MAG: glycosyltransferase [Rhodobacteraceae bacterium]|nr:glycosyltransferase [Paracoccaceae bacterium]